MANDNPYVRANRLILGEKAIGKKAAAENLEKIRGLKKRTMKLGTAHLTGYGRATQEEVGPAEAARRAAAEKEAGEGTSTTPAATSSITVEEMPEFLEANPQMAIELGDAELARVPRPRKGAADCILAALKLSPEAMEARPDLIEGLTKILEG